MRLCSTKDLIVAVTQGSQSLEFYLDGEMVLRLTADDRENVHVPSLGKYRCEVVLFPRLAGAMVELEVIWYENGRRNCVFGSYDRRPAFRRAA